MAEACHTEIEGEHRNVADGLFAMASAIEHFAEEFSKSMDKLDSTIQRESYAHR